jgi:hypothetical protein
MLQHELDDIYISSRISLYVTFEHCLGDDDFHVVSALILLVLRQAPYIAGEPRRRSLRRHEFPSPQT